MITLDEFDNDVGGTLVAPPIPVVPNGYYTITFPDGSHRTFRIHRQRETAKFAPNQRLISLLIGPDNSGTGDYERFGFVGEDSVRVWKKFQGGRDKPSKYERYADLLWRLATGEVIEGHELMVSERCLFCNRELTDPVSIERKIGPSCYERYYGAKG